MPPDAIARLAAALESGRESLPLVRIGGAIQEVTASSARVGGVAAFVKLGDRMGFSVGGREQVAEVVRVDAAGVTLKPFESRIEAGLGTPAFRLGDPILRPDQSWKGRVIDALGRPVDGLGGLVSGPVAVPVDASPPPAMERARVQDALRTGVRAFDLFTPLCVGQRIGVFAGSGVGKSTLLAMLARAEGLRHRRRRPGRRARARGARVPRRRHGGEPRPGRHRRLHRRREPDDAATGAARWR